MEMAKKISRRLLVWIFIWFVVLAAALWSSRYLGIDTIIKSDLSEGQARIWENITETLKTTEYAHWCVLGVVLVVVGLFLWLTLRSSVKRVVENQLSDSPPALDKVKQAELPVDKPSPKVKKPDVSEDMRRAIHLLSLLQREGRLLDFLEEDLGAYDDARIGAAVRNIQESCKKTLDKYLAPKAVMDQEEGDTVTIPEGFDAAVIKLTGNVAGEPPFEGVLQHRGWKITRFDLPTLSGTQDPHVIAPSEVEIP